MWQEVFHRSKILGKATTEKPVSKGIEQKAMRDTPDSYPHDMMQAGTKSELFNCLQKANNHLQGGPTKKRQIIQ